MATENIKNRAKKEEQDLEKGFKVSIAELDNGKVALEYNGKEFKFPKAQPAWVSLFVAHYGEGPEKELSDKKTLDFLAKLIGNDLVEEIIKVADNDFSITDVGEQIVTPIQSYWSEVPEDSKKKPLTSISDS